MKLKEIFLSCSSSSSSSSSSTSPSRNQNLRPIPKKNLPPPPLIPPTTPTTTEKRHKKGGGRGGGRSSSSSSFSGTPPNPNSTPTTPLLNRRIIWLREDTHSSSSPTTEHGIVRWIGWIDGEEIAGIVFDHPLGLGSGWYKNRQLFPCPPNHGGLVAVAGLLLEEDFEEEVVGEDDDSSSSYERLTPNPTILTIEENNNNGKRGTTMPIPQILPPLREEDAERINGRSRGIQGNRNSCYLDATLFSMFSFSSVFDSILLDSSHSPQNPTPHPLSSQIQTLLLSTIINPLRKHLYCPSPPIMRLRSSLEHLDPKLTSEEMDPQEFLQILFGQNVLHLPEFISLISASQQENSDYFHQVIAAASSNSSNLNGEDNENENKRVFPSIQELFEQSLFLQGLKLKRVPAPALILLMPRSGNKYKMFDGILPNLSIDLTDLLDGEVPRCCIICGSLATYECGECYGKFTFPSESSQRNPNNSSSGAESTSFCDTCVHQIHKRRERQPHLDNVKPIKYAFPASQYFPAALSSATTNTTTTTPQQGQLGNWSNPLFSSSSSSRNSTIPPPPPSSTTTSRSIPRVTMDLFAVICIETSHFVSFVKCGQDKKAPWIFFDSMADRVENANGTGQNVPQVRLLPKMGQWLEDLEEKSSEELKSLLEQPNFPTDLKRLISDPYICFYYSREAAMYC